MNLIQNHILDIKNVCEKHYVKHLYAFGSVLSNKFNNESDIDLVVDFKSFDINKYADNYFDLKYSLESILKRHVDLLEESAIKNPYFKQSLNQTKQLVYAA